MIYLLMVQNTCGKHMRTTTLKTSCTFTYGTNHVTTLENGYRRRYSFSPVKVPNETCLSLAMSQTLILFH